MSPYFCLTCARPAPLLTVLNQLSRGPLAAMQTKEVGVRGAMGATQHCAPNPSYRKAEEESWTLPRAPPQLLSNSPDKNLLHLLQPIYLLHPVGRGAEMTGLPGAPVWAAGGGRRLCLQAPHHPGHHEQGPSLALRPQTSPRVHS